MKNISILVMSISCSVVAMDTEKNIPYKEPVKVEDCLATKTRIILKPNPHQKQETIGSNLQRGGRLIAVGKGGMGLTAYQMMEIKKAINSKKTKPEQKKSDICRQIEMVADNKRRFEEMHKNLYFDSYFSRHDLPSKL